MSDSIPSPLDPEFDLDKLKELMGKLELEQQDLQGEINEALDEMAPIDEEIEKLKKKKWAAQRKAQDARHAQSLKRSALQDAENKYRAALLEKNKRDAWEEESKRLDAFTINAKWREWAFDHQITGGKHVTVMGGKVIIGDGMGLGKSLTSLIAADMMDAERVLIISKGEILRNFDKEIDKWADWRTKFSIVSTSKVRRDVILNSIIPKTDEWTLLVNFEAWRKDKTLVKQLQKIRPQLVIIDEAHHLKETDKQAFQGVRDIVYASNMCKFCESDKLEFLGIDGWRCLECHVTLTRDETHSVKGVIPMTGSYILNRPEELFALLHLVDRDAFPTKQHFLTRYCIKEPFTNLMGKTAYRWTFRPGGKESLLKSIGPQFLVRTRKDAGIKLPENQTVIHELEISRDEYADQWRVYRQLESTMGSIFNNDGTSEHTAFAVITLIQRYRQVTSWPAGITIKHREEDGEERIVFQCDVQQSAKIDKAFDLVSEMKDAGERCVIFSKFKAPLYELKRRFATQNTEGGNAIRACMYTGDQSIPEREAIKPDWDASTYDPDNYKYDVILCQYDAAGEGLNLNAATNMVRVDEEWNPGRNAQADYRINRIGQSKETQVHILRIADTIDTDLAELVFDKGQMIEGFNKEVSVIQEMIKRLRARIEQNKRVS